MRGLGSFAQWWLYRLDRRWGRSYRRLRRRAGWASPPVVHPYRGYAHHGRARLLARVLEDRGTPEWAEGGSIVGALAASYRRYATVEVPEVHVDVRWGPQTTGGTTDEEGHLDLEVPVPEGVEPGWRTAEMVLPKTGHRAEASVFVTPPDAEVAVVSDIDDTVIATKAHQPLARAAALFLTDARTRMPFEGVAALYRALHGGRNPLIYLSSSPWNLYDHLEGLFDRHGIPRGPLLLRDWGISEHGLAPMGGHRHKRRRLERLLADFPDLPFVLVGDSGQHDAKHYVAVAREHPGRVRAIVIRDVGTRHRGRLERLAEVSRELGTPFCVAEDSADAARFLAAEGWIRDAAVADVRARADDDRRAPGPVQSAVGADRP
ncbi:MAG TPA: DUF2183 domain-containing protein [Sandaracinaceae bacterium LLY-WYZ-13_1]|nr:DUF2183 domain-containing protein [Sandaracinaceae bacterium LLY-WYZ-13_1]